MRWMSELVSQNHYGTHPVKTQELLHPGSGSRPPGPARTSKPRHSESSRSEARGDWALRLKSPRAFWCISSKTSRLEIEGTKLAAPEILTQPLSQLGRKLKRNNRALRPSLIVSENHTEKTLFGSARRNL